MKKLIALIDCNQFYVSCERAFNPSLEGRPVIVLSNNDGCTVSCSPEAKQIGIPVGVPVFQYRKEIEKHGVVMCSSNYALYSDMSSRVMKVLADCASEIEVYSIDEAFLRFHQAPGGEIMRFASHLRQQVRKKTGIPVSVGVAVSKTLAKLANRIAKKNPSCQGVCYLSDKAQISLALAQTAVGDIWGIGRKYAAWLESQKVHTALQFVDLGDTWIRKRMTIKGLATAWELRGMPCLPFGDTRTHNREICCSLSFGRPVQRLEEIREALTRHVLQAVSQLRDQQAVAGGVGVFIHSHRRDITHAYANYYSISSPQLSDDPFLFIRLAFRALNKIYRPEISYVKTGVFLLDISPKQYLPPSLFEEESSRDKTSEALIQAMEHINRRWGKHTVRPATMGKKVSWDIKRDHLSNPHTTSWKHLPEC